MTMWVRCEQQGEVQHGVLEGERIALYDGAPWDQPKPTGAYVALADTRLLAPVEPRAFIGLWNNFHAAAAKNGHAIPAEPLYFLKSPGSIVGPEAEITPPAGYAGRTLYEGELGVVIGAVCRDVDEASAEAAIFG